MNKPLGLVSEHTTPDVFDFIQALLRLAPDHRAAALTDANDLQGEAGAAVRFALGGEETIGRHAGLWVAAARARDAKGTFPALSAAHGSLGPDSVLPAEYSYTVHTGQSTHGGVLEVTVMPELTQEQCLLDRPLAMLHHHPRLVFFSTSMINVRCHLDVWPANPNAAMADGAMQIIDRLHEPASSFCPAMYYLEPLFDSDTSFSDMAHLCLAAGLLSKDAGMRGMAVDALIAVIDDGRCTGEELGSAFGTLSQAKGIVHLNRLAESLADVARVSSLHRHVAVRIIQETLAALRPPAPADLHHLLTPLREWLILTGEPLSPACRPFLESIRGSGKTAALAAWLVKVEQGAVGHRQAAFVEALRGRVLRAKRWAEREWSERCVLHADSGSQRV